MKNRIKYKPGEEVRAKYTIWVDDLQIPADTLLPILDLTRNEVQIKFQGQLLWVKRVNLKPDTTPSLFPEMEPARQLSLM